LTIEKAFYDAGFTNGEYINLFSSTKSTESIIGHKYVRGVSFCGSTNGGRAIGALAGKHLKKVVCELGGSDPAIVCEDAEIDNAV